jgi:mRNA-degrading endonuclease YafQ of YafQ-DinJ toxin-antitoxin module
MKKIIVSSKFDRAFRRYVRRHPERKGKIQSAIQQLESDVFAQSLGTHPLK